MTQAHPSPLSSLAWLQALRQPQLVLEWTLADWERVVRLARRLRLLARLAESLCAAGLIDRVPPQPRRHLIAEQRLSRWRTGAMNWVLERVATTLGEADYPLVLLKGGAYIGQDLPIAAGRLPSDVDILVPREHLPDAQARLREAGWLEAELDEHDQRYYYEWSHEVPPMTHPLHSVELDLHHNILPPVARTHVDAGVLLSRLQPSKWPAWQVLSPIDQVLHSAAHLFLDSEPRDRVRDLVDLDGLFRHFGADPSFWHGLPERARILGLAEPLALASYFTTSWLGTLIPNDTREAIAALGPGPLRRAWLVPLLGTVLTPTEPDAMPSMAQELAAQIVLARYHQQRMPLRLLVPHIWHKLRTADRAPDKPDAVSTEQR
ncbi:MAG: nucleotidyltransferase family protein [Burkholderiaceae bacterium]